MGERNPCSPTLDLHQFFFKVPKAKSLKDVTKAYKSIVSKPNQDKKNSKKSTTPSSFEQIIIHRTFDEEDIWSNPKILSKSTSRRSKTPSPTTKRTMSRKANRRRCKTPTPESSSSSLSSSSSSSLKRILSLKGIGSASFSRRMSRLEISSPELLPAPSASPPTKDYVHEIISKSFLDQENNDDEKMHSVSLSSNLCGRATTPIIFSQTTARRKPPQVEKKLLCSLEDLCFGCTKKIKVTRDVIKHPGVILQEEEILKIEIKAGWRKGTKITFEGKGDEKPGFLPGDIVFIIDEKPHPLYARNGNNNLEIGVQIPLLDALIGCCIPIPLLGGENMTLSLDNVVIYHGHENVIQGQGMPNPMNKGTRGDLLIKFLIDFPTQLSDQQRQQAFCILQDCF